MQTAGEHPVRAGPGNRLKRQRGKASKRQRGIVAKWQRHVCFSHSRAGKEAKSHRRTGASAAGRPQIACIAPCSASLAPCSCRHGREGRASVMRQSVDLQHPHTAALRAWQPAGSRQPLSQAPGPGEVRSNRMDTVWTLQPCGLKGRVGRSMRFVGKQAEWPGHFAGDVPRGECDVAKCGTTRRRGPRGGSNCAYVSHQVL